MAVAPDDGLNQGYLRDRDPSWAARPGVAPVSHASQAPASGGGDWWGQNAPPSTAAPSPGQAPLGGPSQPPPPAGGGSTWSGAGGGWDEGWAPPSSKILQQAFAQGLTGEPAVQWAKAHGAPEIQFYPDKNQYALPDGAYIAPNPQNPAKLDLIQRAGGGGDGGGGGYGSGSFNRAPGTYQVPTFKAPAPFVAPSGLTEANDPGFQARMKMGTDAIQGAAAAKGSLLSGGTLKALERYGQDYGSNEYGKVYDRAAQGYGMNTANDWRTQENQAQYGLTGYQTNIGTQRGAQQDYWGRLQDLYQGGQRATQQTYQRP